MSKKNAQSTVGQIMDEVKRIDVNATALVVRADIADKVSDLGRREMEAGHLRQMGELVIENEINKRKLAYQQQLREVNKARSKASEAVSASETAYNRKVAEEVEAVRKEVALPAVSKAFEILQGLGKIKNAELTSTMAAPELKNTSARAGKATKEEEDEFSCSRDSKKIELSLKERVGAIHWDAGIPGNLNVKLKGLVQFSAECTKLLKAIDDAKAMVDKIDKVGMAVREEMNALDVVSAQKHLELQDLVIEVSDVAQHFKQTFAGVGVKALALPAGYDK